MDREALAEKYVAAWNAKDLSAILRLAHPQASFYDSYWSEIGSGSGLRDFLSASFEADNHWYRRDQDIIATANGMIIRYVAFALDDPGGHTPVFNGAEVITIADGLILTVSDFYCNPDPVELVEISKLAEKVHSRSHISTLGLSPKISSRINRRLAELTDDMTVFIQPSLTVTKLADHVGCSVMHLFHVLEEEKGTTFLRYVNECRARYATTLLVDKSLTVAAIDQIATMSGFETVQDFRNAFQTTFSISPEEYLQQFGQ